MQGGEELTDEEIRKVASKYVGVKKEMLMKFERLRELTFQMPEEAKAALNEIPDEDKFVLYTDDMENMKKFISASEVKVLAEYPLINGIVVFGERKKIFRLVLNDSIKEFDVIRKVKVAGASDSG